VPQARPVVARRQQSFEKYPAAALDPTAAFGFWYSQGHRSAADPLSFVVERL